MKLILLICAIVLIVFITGSYSEEVEKVPTDPAVCSLKADRGPCRAGFKRFYYNPEAKECEEFLYGGCAGNENRFKLKPDCEKLCKV